MKRCGPATRIQFAGLGLAVGLWILSASGVQGRDAHVAIFYTTDLHGYLLPSYIYTGEEQVGGLLRCATLIRDGRREMPNSLLLDAGDLIQGGMESYPSRGEVMLEAIDLLGYDAWAIGNHEFDWGYENLARILKGRKTPALAGNIGVRPGQVNPLDTVEPFILREVDGVRFAIIGLTTPGMPNWFLPEMLGPLVFERSVEALDRIMPEVRAAKPHIIILLLHQGWRHSGDSFGNEVQEIARRFPEIDIMIGGHSHQVVESTLLGRTLYAQSGYHGNWLGRIDLVYDLVQLRAKRMEARLMEVGRDTPYDEALSEHFAPLIARESARRAKVLAQTRQPLEAKSALPGQSSQQRLIAEALVEAAQADIVLHGSMGEYRISEGAITEYDLFRIVPYENRIGVLALTAEEIRSVLEENAAQYGRHAFMGIHGLRYDLEPSAAAGRRVSNLTLSDGSLPHSRRRYRVVFNSYVLASGGRRYHSVRTYAGQAECRLELLEMDTREAVRSYLKNQKLLDLAPLPGARLIPEP